MSTTTLTYPKVIPIRCTLAIGLIAILIITSLVLIVGAFLVIVSSTTQDASPVDVIPVAHNTTDSLPVAVPLPTAPAASAQPLSSETPTPLTLEIKPSVVPVPVPTPLSS